MKNKPRFTLCKSLTCGGCCRLLGASGWYFELNSAQFRDVINGSVWYGAFKQTHEQFAKKDRMKIIFTRMEAKQC